jgi:hypothetical protein
MHSSHLSLFSLSLSWTHHIDVNYSPCLIKGRAVVLSWRALWLLTFTSSFSSQEEHSVFFF